MMFEKRIFRATICALVILIWVLAGCAGRTVYTVQIEYDAGGAEIPAYVKPTARALQSILYVAEFTDARVVDDPLVIGRVIERNGIRSLVLPKFDKPTLAAATGVRHYLRQAGYNVGAVVAPWDLSEANMPSVSGRVLIGGRIDDLDINVVRNLPTNTYTTRIKMTLFIADAQRRQIVHRTGVEAQASLEHVAFSEDRMGYQAGIALGEAIEKLFEKREITQAIRDIIER